MAETSQANIDDLCAILGLENTTDRQIISSALKAHSSKANPADEVVNEYFTDGADKFRQKYSWDESSWMADRDGSNNPPFQIHAPDEPATNGDWQQGTGLSAPSRPPSRTQNRSPLGAPTTQAQEDEDLARAIAESNAASGGITPQESGIIAADTSLPVFGPATRDNYDNDQWAMVRTSQGTSDPPPSGRKREAEVPVFLICRQQGDQRHRLGPLLMIKHNIPAARNFLLSSIGQPTQRYGNDNAWWMGQSIKAPGNEVASEAPETWVDDSPNVRLLDEVHRLMAFLDATDRSYGTADSLCESPLMRTVWGDPVVRFYESLYAKLNPEGLRSMWTTVRLGPTWEEGTSISQFAILEFNVPSDLPKVFRNLYSIWDILFWINKESQSWGCPDEEPSQVAYVQEPSEILTMRIKVDGQPLDIPEIFYADRYLEQNIEIAVDLKSKMFRLWKAVESATEKENSITKYKDPTRWKEYDKSVLTKQVIEQNENRIWQVRANALWRKHEELVGTEEAIPYLPNELIHLAELNEEEDKAVKHFEATIELAKRKMAKIDRKLARIRAEKEACCTLLKELDRTLTAASEDAELRPTLKYTLRGVTTSPEVVYMCRREQAETSEANGAVGEVDQWWRVYWVADDENRVKQERTTFDKVREAIFTETDTDGSKAPILVYATDKALAEEPVHLSDALQTFVKFDNRLFKQELLEEPSPREKKRSAHRSRQSPTKRPRSDSIDSMATNRASMGDFSDVEERAALLADQDDPFQGGDGTVMGTEMLDMRPISMTGLVGAPPTPPLSAEDGASERGSPGLRRSSERLASFTLNNEGPKLIDLSESESQLAGGPEMQERPSSFIVRPPANGVMDKRVSIMDRSMEIDNSSEVAAQDENPEDFYR